MKRLSCAPMGILVGTSVGADTSINLPRSVFGGAQICDVSGCKRTQADLETTARIISYHPDTGTIVEIAGRRFYVPGNQVGLTFKGRSMTLRSYLARSYCGGKPWPE